MLRHRAVGTIGDIFHLHTGRVDRAGKRTCRVVSTFPGTASGVDGFHQTCQPVIDIGKGSTAGQGFRTHISIEVESTCGNALKRIAKLNHIAAGAICVLLTRAQGVNGSSQASAFSILKFPESTRGVFIADQVTCVIVG